MRIPRLSHYALACVTLGSILSVAPVGTAQSRAPVNAGLGILVVPVDTVFSDEAASVVTFALAELRRTAPSAELRVYSWLDVVRSSPTDLPQPGVLSSSDLIEAARAIGAVIVALEVDRRADGVLDIRPTLMTWQKGPAIVQWTRLTAPTSRAAGQQVAQRILSDSLVRLIRAATVACPATALFEFQVDAQAHLIDRAAAGRNHPGGGETLLQFVVDTLGRAEPATFKVLKTSDTTIARTIQEAARGWRFEPARRGMCRVRQVVQMAVN